MISCVVVSFENKLSFSLQTEVFIKSTDEFLAYSMQLIRRHRLIFPPTGTDQCLRLGNLIL